jgi:branched-chain amino acid transport system substrate-binding protein
MQNDLSPLADCGENKEHRDNRLMGRDDGTNYTLTAMHDPAKCYRGFYMRQFTHLVAIVLLLGGAFRSYAGGSAEVIVGGVAPLTGEFNDVGASSKRGIEMAVKEWNASGGVLGKQIKLILVDDKCDPAGCTAACTKLIQQDRVVAIIGSAFSIPTIAGAHIAQTAKIPMITPIATNPEVTKVGNYIYRACFLDSLQGSVGAMFSFNSLKAGKAACIFDVGNDYSRGLAEFFKDKFVEIGGQVVDYEGYAPGTTDFAALLVNTLKSRPDIIYCPSWLPAPALIAKQARALGFKGQLVGGDSWDSPYLVKDGGSAVEGFFFTVHFSKDDSRPAVKDFVKKFKTNFQVDPDSEAALYYDATFIMLDAIKRAGKIDGSAIREALTKTNIDVITGQIKFDENRNPMKSVVIVGIKDGQQVYVSTVYPTVASR